MAHVTLPLRIRPSRARLIMRAGILCFSSSPIFAGLWGSHAAIFAALSGPWTSGAFFGACAAAGFTAVCAGLLLMFLLEALPGAPFRHIDVDADGVTSRYWMFVRRILHRDIDGWGVVERELRTANAEWPPIRWRVYFAVAGRGVHGGQRTREARRRFSMTVGGLAYTPPGADRDNFAGLLALFLDDCRAARGHRPIVVDVPEPLASQVFALTRHAPKTPRPSKAKPPRARMPGRFPTNEDMAAHWSSEAIQAMRASDDLPAFDSAAEKAYFYDQLARRDRKRLARERRAARLRKRREHEAPER